MKKLKKVFGVFAVALLLMSMSSESLTKQDFTINKQDACYELGVWVVGNMGIEDPGMQHAVHGYVYDNCMSN